MRNHEFQHAAKHAGRHFIGTLKRAHVTNEEVKTKKSYAKTCKAE